MTQHTGLVLERQEFTNKSTIGSIYYKGDFVCYSLELPWIDNKTGESCIPVGDYTLEHHKYRDKLDTFALVGDTVSHWCGDGRLQRCAILFHPANTPEELDGCIGTGLHKSVNEMHESRKAFHKLYDIIKRNKVTEITII